MAALARLQLGANPQCRALPPVQPSPGKAGRARMACGVRGQCQAEGCLQARQLVRLEERARLGTHCCGGGSGGQAHPGTGTAPCPALPGTRKGRKQQWDKDKAVPREESRRAKPHNSTLSTRAKPCPTTQHPPPPPLPPLAAQGGPAPHTRPAPANPPLQTSSTPPAPPRCSGAPHPPGTPGHASPSPRGDMGQGLPAVSPRDLLWGGEQLLHSPLGTGHTGSALPAGSSMEGGQGIHQRRAGTCWQGEALSNLCPKSLESCSGEVWDTCHIAKPSPERDENTPVTSRPASPVKPASGTGSHARSSHPAQPPRPLHTLCLGTGLEPPAPALSCCWGSPSNHRHSPSQKRASGLSGLPNTEQGSLPVVQRGNRYQRRGRLLGQGAGSPRDKPGHQGSWARGKPPPPCSSQGQGH